MMRKGKEKKLSGRLIVEKQEPEREEKSLDTERERVRKRAKRKKIFSAIVAVVLGVVLCVLLGVLVKNLAELADQKTKIAVSEEKIEPTVNVIDENGNGGISGRMKEYIAQLESDLKDLGYEMVKAVLPMGKMREIDIDIAGVAPYFKVNVERGAAVSAEDIVRMIKYLSGQGMLEQVTYVDVRVEGKAFYK
ncbi:hypothetical protein IJF86_02785 [Candidatus Saccharibacteria bacterium]|nr:hypothetical protein [Candidatus Saccharibacteria bacterium]